MARIRTIKPDAFQSETLAQVSIEAERTFFGLLTQADDEGRFKDRPHVLNGALWPVRTPLHSSEALDDEMSALSAPEVGLLCRYEVDGVRYAHLTSFKEHQRVNRPSKSKIPACPRCSAAPASAGAEPGLFGQGATRTA